MQMHGEWGCESCELFQKLPTTTAKRQLWSFQCMCSKFSKYYIHYDYDLQRTNIFTIFKCKVQGSFLKLLKAYIRPFAIEWGNFRSHLNKSTAQQV